MRLYIKINKPNEPDRFKVVELSVLDQNSVEFTLDSFYWTQDEINNFEADFYMHVHTNSIDRFEYENSITTTYRHNINASAKTQLDVASFLIQHAVKDNISEKEHFQTLEVLKKLKQNLLKEIQAQNNSNPDLQSAVKHKKPFNSASDIIIDGTQRHTTHEIKNAKNQPCVVKDALSIELSESEEFTAFFAQLARYVLGAEHAANTRCIVDEHGIAIGTRQKKIDGLETLAQKATKNSLPSKEKLVKAGLIEALAAAFVFADPDMHANNIGLDAKGNIILFDFDQWLSSFIDGYLYQDPSNSFPITLNDLKKFPFIEDAKPDWWLPKENKSSTLKISEHLKDLDKITGVQYRAFKLFLRACLLDEATIRKFAETHIRSRQSREKIVAYLVSRLKDLKEKLLSLDEFKRFLDMQPHEEIIQDLESYNASFSEKNRDFRINIQNVRNVIYSDFKSPEIHQSDIKSSLEASLQELESLHSKTKVELDQITGDYSKFSIDTHKLFEDIFCVKNDINTWPQNGKSSNAIQEKLAILTKHFESVKNNFSEKHKNIDVYIKVNSLSEKIENLHKFYGSNSDDCPSYTSRKNESIKQKIDEIFKKIKNVRDALNKDGKATAENRVNENIIYIERTLLSEFANSLQDEHQSPLEKGEQGTIENLSNKVQNIIDKKFSEFKKNTSHYVFVGLHHEWHFKNTLNKCAEMIGKTTKENLQASVLKAIEAYLQRSGNKTPSYRLNNICRIIQKIEEVEKDSSFKNSTEKEFALRNKLEGYLKHIKNNRLPISNLRYAIYDCIRKFDNEEYFKNRKAAPTA